MRSRPRYTSGREPAAGGFYTAQSPRLRLRPRREGHTTGWIRATITHLRISVGLTVFCLKSRATTANGDRNGRAVASDHQRLGQDHERSTLHEEADTGSLPSLRFFVFSGSTMPLATIVRSAPILSEIKAVQTLSRLNRAHPKKHDVFVLDFLNDAETITEAFSTYYRIDGPGRRDRPQQASRPAGRPSTAPRCTRPTGSGSSRSGTWTAWSASNSTPFWTAASPCT